MPSVAADHNRRKEDDEKWRRKRRFDLAVGTLLALVTVGCVVTAFFLIGNGRADARREEQQAQESRRTCVRSYRAGVGFGRMYLKLQRAGFVDRETVRIYVQGIPGLAERDVRDFVRSPLDFPPLPRQTIPLERACPA